MNNFKMEINENLSVSCERKYKLLSGKELVSKGATKINSTLPEVGPKKVVSDGSWLEQKQVQAALEGRKYLVKVERIEKRGVLTCAEWNENLMKAEVTHKVGGCWQFVGHNEGPTLYLYPEEALFLIESNILLLKHNGVIVSLQKAYTLLLRDKVSIAQYQVYASLSRLGYKVFRHKEPTNSNRQKVVTQENYIIDNLTKVKSEKESMVIDMDIDKEIISPKNKNEIQINNQCNSIKTEDMTDKDMKICNENSNENVYEKENCSNGSYPQVSEIPLQKNKLNQLRQLKKQHKCCNIKDEYFENIPELCNKHVVTVKSPSSQNLPANLILAKATYDINLDKISGKNTKQPMYSPRTYSVSDEVNGSHVRRVADVTNSDTFQFNRSRIFNVNSAFNGQNSNFRQYTWRTYNDFVLFPFHMFFRPYTPNFHNFMPRYNLYPRTQPNFNFQPYFHSNNYNRNAFNNSRTRDRSDQKMHHLQAIKRLAARLKALSISGYAHQQNINGLTRLIYTYNTRYKTNLRLTADLDVVEDIVETIELADDEEIPNKKRRLSDNSNSYSENINQLKQLALKLKSLQINNKATARHRRAFSNAIKKFNKCYNADVYMDNDEIIDRSLIVLDSDSDSDCVLEETVPKEKSGKKLRNPFNILKKLTEKHKTPTPSTSQEIILSDDDNNTEQDFKYSDYIVKTFNKNWLPNENSFGRAEVTSQNIMYSRIVLSNQESMIDDFLKSQQYSYKNWAELKYDFWKNINESCKSININDSNTTENVIELNCLIKPENCTDLLTILKKLSIISSCNNSVDTDSDEINLKIDFDVYKRDVQNFRKTMPPEPHFRIVCVEATNVPSGSQITTLHRKYSQDVIIFAIVSLGSVSYLQMNPVELPMYVPNNDL